MCSHILSLIISRNNITFENLPNKYSNDIKFKAVQLSRQYYARNTTKKIKKKIRTPNILIMSHRLDVTD